MNLAHIGYKKIGVVYMAFGEKSAHGVYHSASTLHSFRPDIPVAVVGNTPVEGTQFIPWTGHNPWNGNEPDVTHRFFAGYVKPFLYQLSPFDFTLYIDADTEFRRDPTEGFQRLVNEDFLIYQAPPGQCSIEIIFNKKLFTGFSQECAKDILDKTRKDKQVDPGVICSGILFFKKTPGVEQLFKDWYEEWMKYYAWDEQMPLISVMLKHKDVKIGFLNSSWNCNTDNKRQIIHHDWGIGIARDDYFPIDKIESIPGYIGDKDERELYKRAQSVGNGYILELGSLFGRSAATLGLAAPKAKIFSVDNYSHDLRLDEDIDFSPDGNTKRLAELGIYNVTFLKGDSQTVKLPNVLIDLLWIDCGHEYENVTKDLNKYAPRSKVICLHDYKEADGKTNAFPGVTKAVDEFISNNPEWYIDHHVWSTVTLCRKANNG